MMLGIHKNILHSLEKTSWFVECVSVLDWANKTTRIFPCYHSIEDGKYVSMTSKTSEKISFRCHLNHYSENLVVPIS